MVGVRKAFDRGLYNANDACGKRVVKDLFGSKGIPLVEGTQFGIDLRSECGKVKVEVERRSEKNWPTGEFPFDEVNIPARKIKYLREGQFFYAVVSNDGRYIGVLPPSKVDEYLREENARESSNRFVRNGEFFVKVPCSTWWWFRDGQKIGGDDVRQAG